VRAAASRLSDQDHRLLADVHRLQVASGQQLRRLHYPNSPTGRRAARLALAELTELRVLARLDRRVGGVRSGSEGFIYRLDVIGQRLLRPESDRRRRAPWTPQPSFLAHALAVNELYVQLEESQAQWRLERFDAEPRCWRRFVGVGGRPQILKPDAFLVGTDESYEDHYFIEIDRSTESLPRIVEKAQQYISYWESGREQVRDGVFPLVLWIAPTQRRREQLVEALSEVDAEHWRLFVTSTDEHAAAFITGELSEDVDGEVAR
jgi:hypothetical protein